MPWGQVSESTTYWSGRCLTTIHRIKASGVNDDAWERTIPYQAEGMKPDIAFYYPGQYWLDTDWAKNLVLFFDGIGMLIPTYMPDQGRWDDFPVVQSLKENELFYVIRPEDHVRAEETQELATAIESIIESGGLDALTHQSGETGFQTEFGSLSMSRMGYFGDRLIAETIFRTLRERGLASDSEDGVSIPMHRAVRGLVLVLLSQIIKTRGEGMGLTLSPATDQVQFVRALTSIIASASTSTPTAGDVVSFDMDIVGIDLSDVPIDDVLAFRRENYLQHRDYRVAVRKFARALSEMPAEERPAVFEQRQEELRDAASALRSEHQASWKRAATFALGLVAAALSFFAGNIPGAAVAGASSAVNAIGGSPADLGCYSYLFEAKRAL